MDAGGHEVPRNRQGIRIVKSEDLLREVGTVSDWCLRHGQTLGHPANVSAKVARIITLGCNSNPPLCAELLREVPEATAGSWWITEAAVDGHHLETYQRLACLAEDFREDVWKPERQERRSKWTLRVVEEEMKLFRLGLFVAQIDREDPLTTTTKTLSNNSRPAIQLNRSTRHLRQVRYRAVAA